MEGNTLECVYKGTVALFEPVCMLMGEDAGWRGRGRGGSCGSGNTNKNDQRGKMEEKRRRGRREEFYQVSPTSHEWKYISVRILLSVKDIVRGRCSGVKLPAERFPG